MSNSKLLYFHSDTTKSTILALLESELSKGS